MHEALRVSGHESPLDASCLIEVDDYVPLRFRTYDYPLGASYLQLGDGKKSLVELLVDPTRGHLRGITVTAFPALSAWPQFSSEDGPHGLPVFATPPLVSKRAEVRSNISVAVSDNNSNILLYWAPLENCRTSTFEGRVHFLEKDGLLAGVHFGQLSSKEVKLFASQARSG